MMGEPEAPPRSRRKLVLTVFAIGSLVAFLAIFALWAKRQFLETQTWTDTSTELLEDREIQDAVVTFTVGALFDNVPVQQQVEAALPPRAAPAAGAIAGALRQLADNLAREAIQSPKVQALWEEANKRAHEQLVDVVEKGGSEDVTLDLGTIVDELGAEVGVSDASSKLPAGAADVVIFENDDLVAAQNVIELLETLAWVLVALFLVLFGFAIYLAEGWRRIALRNIGWAFIVVGIAALVIRGLAGDALTNHLADTEAIEPAISSAWTIGTSLLKDIGGATVFYGVVFLIGAWLAGPAGFGRDARRGIAPVLAGRGTAYGALAILLLLLFWWSPTPGFERLPTSIVIVALFVIGLEALRPQARRDFPDQTWEVGVERWRGAIRALGRGRSRASSA